MPVSTSFRVRSIDILRGLVMIIMALDHTRDFFHRPAMTADPLAPATTTAAIFFTRWITHLCAPTFVFLSGLSAYLSAQKKNSAEASMFLINRGLWLLIVEMVIVTFGITFDPGFHLVIWQVIWAIGWSMIILGIVRQWPRLWITILGAAIFFGHDLLRYANIPAKGTVADMISILFTSPGRIIPINSTHAFGDFYAIVPWTGIMLLGYAMGPWFTRDFSPAVRKRNLLITSLGLLALFVVLRTINKYGDPSPRIVLPEGWRSFLSFMNVSKYPPSLMYASATLGIALFFLAVSENIRGKWSEVASVYGRVPFFYYVLHFYILHIILVIVFFATGHRGDEIAGGTFIHFRPAEFGFPLWVVYVIWLSVVASLYFPCRWFHRYKQGHGQWWLKYL